MLGKKNPQGNLGRKRDARIGCRNWKGREWLSEKFDFLRLGKGYKKRNKRRTANIQRSKKEEEDVEGVPTVRHRIDRRRSCRIEKGGDQDVRTIGEPCVRRKGKKNKSRACRFKRGHVLLTGRASKTRSEDAKRPKRNQEFKSHRNLKGYKTR